MLSVVGAVLCALFVSTASASAAASIAVSTTADSGAGSLRAAIEFANTRPGTTIVFAIPGNGVHTIAPATPLPTVAPSTAIDGTTQNGYKDAPLIRVDGSAPGDAGGSGLVLSAADTIRGLEVTGWSTGVAMPASNGGDVVEASYIGTDGTRALPNGSGISITGPTDPTNPNTIGGTGSLADRNLISGNSGDGIVLSGDQVQGNLIAGNDIGLGADGFGPVGNNGAGILIENGAHDNVIGGEAGPVIGDCSVPSRCNEIAENRSHGVAVDGAGTTGNAIEANMIYDNAPPDISLTNGGNDGETAPVIASVPAGGNGTVSGTVSPGTHLVEVFSSGCASPEVTTFLGSVATSSTHWSLSLDGRVALDGLVATSTSLSTSDTSEYSSCVPVPPEDCGGVVATTQAATDITSSSATLHGTVHSPCLAYANGHFEYGTSTAYGHDAGFGVPSGGQTYEQGFTISQRLTNLVPNTTYHFRAVGSDLLACKPPFPAANCGFGYGSDMTFVTLPLPPSLVTIGGPRVNVTRAFRAKVFATCPSSAPVACQGTLALTRHRRTLGKVSYTLAPGTGKTLRVRLDRLGRRLMRRHRRLLVQVSGAGVSGGTIRLVRSFRVRHRR